MYKISKIISLPIISLYESEYQGTIYNIVFDCKSQKCKFIYLLNEEDNIEKIISFSDIYTIGKHCIFIKNNSCLILKSNCDYLINNLTSLINLPVYNMKGDNIGTTKDIELDEKFDLQNIILSNGTSIPRTQIINFGKTTILVNDIIVNIAKFKPKLKTIKPYNCPSKVIILKDGEVVLSGNKYDVFKCDIEKYGLKRPKIIEFEQLVLKEKGIKMLFRDDINDLMKDVYRHVK
jgi:sporulation protein YlmC with PRC-barrel domain